MIDAKALAAYIEQDPDKLGLNPQGTVEDVAARLNAHTQVPLVCVFELDSWLHQAMTPQGIPVYAALRAVAEAGASEANPLWPLAVTVLDWCEKAAGCATTDEPGRHDAYQWLDASGQFWPQSVAYLTAAKLITEEQAAQVLALARPRYSAAEVQLGGPVAPDMVKAVLHDHFGRDDLK